MNEDDRFEIGLALNAIAMMLSDNDFQRVKQHLKRIEKIVAKQTEPKGEA